VVERQCYGIENLQQLVQNNVFECGLEFIKLRLFDLFINLVNLEETNIFDPNERQIKDNYKYLYSIYL